MNYHSKLITRVATILACGAIGGNILAAFFSEVWWFSVTGALIGLIIGYFLPID